MSNDDHADSAQSVASAAPPSQLPVPNDAATAESPDPLVEEQNATDEENLTLAEILKKYIPEDSVLMDSIERRRSTGWIKSDRTDIRDLPWHYHDARLKNTIDRTRQADSLDGRPSYSVLVIQDIDLEWSKRLTEWFSSPDQAFLAQHMLRLDDPQTYDALLELNESLSGLHQDSTATRSVHVRSYVEMQSVCLPLAPKDVTCFHVDDVYFGNQPGNIVPSWVDELESAFSTSLGSITNGYRENCFKEDDNGQWRKSSVRLSCCQLHDRLYLVLVDPPLDSFNNRQASVEHPYIPRERMALLEHPSLLQTPGSWRQKILYATINHSMSLRILLRYHTVQSVFRPQAAPLENRDHFSNTRERVARSFHGGISAHIIILLLRVSFWQFVLFTIEETMKQFRLFAMREPGERSFPLLIRFRGQLAGAHEFVGLFREKWQAAMDRENFTHWYVRGQGKVDRQTFWSTDRETFAPDVPATEQNAPQTVDVRNIANIIASIESKIEAMAGPLNEEIQMVIGAVQVEDAKTMKRQTEWTVVLGILAAIYLPLTLVTGIFGMNIREISMEERAPDKWDTIKIWGLVFGSTVGSILAYAIGRTWLVSAWRIGKMLLWRGVRYLERNHTFPTRRSGWQFFAFLIVLRRKSRDLWIFRKVRAFRQRWRELDIEAQNLKGK